MAQKFPNLWSQTVSYESRVPEHVGEEYGLDRISIIIKNGQEISLVEVLSRVEIYEDIFAPSITGYVQIRDFVGGLEKFQITGGETIRIRVFKPGTTSSVIDRSDLVVHTVTKGKQEDNNYITYKLQFVSKSHIKSQKKKISKSFDSETKKERDIVKIIQSLCGEMGASVNIREHLPLVLNRAFVVPNYSPIEAIQWIAKRMCSSGDYYLFFERVNGGKVFCSLNNLKQLAPKPQDNSSLYNIVYRPSLSYMQNKNSETYIRASYVETQKNFNHLDNMISGVYRTKLTEVDLMNRTFSEREVGIGGIKDFYITNVVSGEFANYSESPDHRMFVKGINDYHNKMNWIEYDLHGARLLTGMRIVAGIVGSTNCLGVGDIAYLSLPSDFAKSRNLEKSDVVENNMYSGRYFVTAVKHVITKDNYIKHVEFSRSSYRNANATEQQAEVVLSAAQSPALTNSLSYEAPQLPTVEVSTATNTSTPSVDLSYLDLNIPQLNIDLANLNVSTSLQPQGAIQQTQPTISPTTTQSVANNYNTIQENLASRPAIKRGGSSLAQKIVGNSRER